MAISERGFCSISLGSDDTEMETALATTFPTTTRVRTLSKKEPCLTMMVDHIMQHWGWKSSAQCHVNIPYTPPLDVPGSIFQWRVWRALMRIPSGQTRSYAELAKLIGQPSSARAVGQACASNQLALIVPCHRVIHSNGSTGHWRWGAKRKRQLLAYESGQWTPAIAAAEN